MGQQQLLLVVLSVIVVGMAIVVGINMFNEGAEAANIDSVTNDVVNMASKAQQYYMKPTAMGGGGRAFTGLAIADLGSASNANGDSFAVVVDNANQVTITGTCAQAEDADGNAVTVVAVVSPTTITTTVNN